MKRFRFLITLIVVLLVVSAGWAEDMEVIKAQVSRETVNLGDTLIYTVEVMTAGEKQFSPDITLPDFSQLFQVTDTFSRSSVNILNGRTHIINFKEVHLIANRTGRIRIPPSTVELIDPGTNQRLVRQTNSVGVQVNESTGKAAIPTPTPEIDVLKPIKKSARLNASQWSPFVIGGGMIVLLFTLMAYLRSRPKGEKPKPAEPVDPRTPEERALEALEAAIHLKTEGKLDEFYTQLSSILRRFMSETFEFKAEESTTREMLREMERLQFKPRFLEKYRKYFIECDQVKFAQVKPPSNSVETMLPRVKDLIGDEDKQDLPEPEPEPEAEQAGEAERDKSPAEKS